MAVWTADERNVVPTGRKTRALLAILALSTPRPVLRGKLAEMLWSRRPEDQARASLRQELHRLQDALDPLGPVVLTIQRDQVSLRQDLVSVDVEDLLRASLDDPAALGLLGGELLEDLENLDPAFDQWLANERERLGDRARRLGEALLLRQSEPNTVIPAAQRLLLIDRTHEGAWRALMQAYNQLGEQGLAIQAFERCRAALADQLDAQPSAVTMRLAAAIRAGQAATLLDASVVPPVGDPAPVRHKLPGQDPSVQPDGGPTQTGLGTVSAPPAGSRRRGKTLAWVPGGGPCVGVLPLTAVGDPISAAAPELAVANEITAALVRFRWLSIMSPSAVGRLDRPSQDGGLAYASAGLNYVVDGSVQRSGNAMRVSVQLIGLGSAPQVMWSRRFDGAAADVLALQDQVAAEASAQLDTQLLLLEGQAVDLGATTGPRYDTVLAAMRLMSRLDSASFVRAGTQLQRAADAAPAQGMPHAWTALWHVLALEQDWTLDRAATGALAREHADAAVAVDPADARLLTVSGHVRAREGRLREALALHERALANNPNLAMAHGFAALTLAYLGRTDAAASALRECRRLDPLGEGAVYPVAAGLALATARHDLDMAVALGRDLTEARPQFRSALGLYLSALGHAGLTREAGLVRARLQAGAGGTATPARLTVADLLAEHPFENPAHRERFAAGLSAAGVSGSLLARS